MDKYYTIGAPGVVMPAEWSRHKCTWMALGGSRALWGAKGLQRMQLCLLRLALVVSDFEPVRLLVRPSELPGAREQLSSLRDTEPNITLVQADLDDIWARDTCPVFVNSKQAGGKLAVGLNFNGWGCKVKHKRDGRVAPSVAALAGCPMLPTDLVMEGGGLEVDGEGTALLTESCILNRNRNPLLTKSACELELSRLFGISKCIWFTGSCGHDITDGHIDGYCRFVRPGVVVAHFDPDERSLDHAVTRDVIAALRRATDAAGNPIQVHVMPGPDSVRSRNPEFCASYVNFYVCNGAVICPSYGCERTDALAVQTFRELFPGREVVAVDVDAISEGGGGVHCVTMQEPELPGDEQAEDLPKSS